MKLLEKIISTLDNQPPVEQVTIGPFDTAVKSRRWGLSSTFRDPCSGDRPAWVRQAGDLVGMGAKELAGYALSDRLLEASLGMAAINSLLDAERFRMKEVNAAHLIAGRGRGKKVAVVGDFPFLRKLKGEVGELGVVSRPPWEGEAGVEEAAGVLPGAEVAAITASSFINGTIEALLALCPKAYTIILGPTAPFSEILFDYGVDAVSGALVDDPDQALPCIREGASFRQVRGLRRITIFKPESER
ncbi:MAG: DUF364 domain-containing protein [Candidatus Erginobacter occultus]|nr:DUF364 domain-containing protein [Candidatus Erginobacter occultus]